MNGLKLFVGLFSILPSLIGVQSIDRESRIVNGQTSEFLGYAAFIEGYKNGRISFRAGTVISQRYVLTVANIIHGHDDMWYVHWGSNVAWLSYTSLSYDAIAHPNYNPETLEHDIGLIAIKNADTFQEVGLPPPLANIPLPNEQGDVRSWGYNNTEPFDRGDTLQVSYPIVVERDTCKDLLGIRGDLVKDNHFCAMDTIGMSSMCVGDEGAGFIVDIDGTKTVVGVLSFYTNMCNPNFPAVYTRVSPYVDWIREIINSGRDDGM